MITRFQITNFKRLGQAELQLGHAAVFIGPNNSGKTNALQALALWDVAWRRWAERRDNRAPSGQTGVTITNGPGVPQQTYKRDYHGLADGIPIEEIPEEVSKVLGLLAESKPGRPLRITGFGLRNVCDFVSAILCWIIQFQRFHFHSSRRCGRFPKWGKPLAKGAAPPVAHGPSGGVPVS